MTAGKEEDPEMKRWTLKAIVSAIIQRLAFVLLHVGRQRDPRVCVCRAGLFNQGCGISHMTENVAQEPYADRNREFLFVSLSLLPPPFKTRSQWVCQPPPPTMYILMLSLLVQCRDSRDPCTHVTCQPEPFCSKQCPPAPHFWGGRN